MNYYYLSLSLSLYIYIYIHIYTHMYVCMCICMSVYLYLSIYPSIYLSLYTYIHIYIYICIYIYIYIYTWAQSRHGRRSEKGEVLLRGVGTQQLFVPPNASVQGQPDGLTIYTKEEWFLGAGFLGAPPISLKWPCGQVPRLLLLHSCGHVRRALSRGGSIMNTWHSPKYTFVLREAMLLIIV